MRNRSLAAVGAALLVLLPGLPAARAQQAPIGQADGGRGGIADGGSGGAAVPLDLPAERHGLPVPVQLAFTGGAQVGEGGVGWTVPMSFISQNDTFSRQRPRNLGTFHAPVLPPPQHPEIARATLTLFGQTRAIVPIDSAGHWRVVVGDQAMEITRTGFGWEVTDGTGLRYRFENVASLGNPSLWMLTQIESAHAGSRVTLQYRAEPRTVGGLTAPELYLDAVQYDFDESGTCAKHEVLLKYATPPGGTQGALLGVFVDNGRLRVRTPILTHVTVTARGDQCGTPSILRTYELRHAPDADTGLPRLVSVDVYGRSGTPEASAAAPIARYVYGRTTYEGYGEDKRGALVYAERYDMALPGGQSFLGEVSEGSLGGRPGFVTDATLMDLDGDGQVDFLQGDLWYRNGGGLAFSAAQPVIPTMPGVPSVLAMQQNNILDRPTESAAFEDTWFQLIDMNADGRLDIVDAVNPPLGYWRLYLNLPTGWQLLDVDIRPVYDVLHEHHIIGLDHKLPLSRSVTGTLHEVAGCYESKLISGQRRWEICSGYVPEAYVINPEVTRVAWTLRDVNGDGYPDLVANELRTAVRSTPGYGLSPFSGFQGNGCRQTAGQQPPEPGTQVRCYDRWLFEWRKKVNGTWETADDDENRLMVFLNRAGATPHADGLFAQ
jgi:hypothetical protein